MAVQKLAFPMEIEKLGEAVAFVEEIMKVEGASRKVISQVSVAVDEIFTNIVIYSGGTKAEITCEVRNQNVQICFMDNGKPYDPATSKEPDVTLSAEERPIGGLGIFIVRKMMDSIEYKFKNGWNILKITKHL